MRKGLSPIVSLGVIALVSVAALFLTGTFSFKLIHSAQKNVKNASFMKNIHFDIESFKIENGKGYFLIVFHNKISKEDLDKLRILVRENGTYKFINFSRCLNCKFKEYKGPMLIVLNLSDVKNPEEIYNPYAMVKRRKYVLAVREEKKKKRRERSERKPEILEIFCDSCISCTENLDNIVNNLSDYKKIIVHLKNNIPKNSNDQVDFNGRITCIGLENRDFKNKVFFDLNGKDISGNFEYALMFYNVKGLKIENGSISSDSGFKTLDSILNISNVSVRFDSFGFRIEGTYPGKSCLILENVSVNGSDTGIFVYYSNVTIKNSEINSENTGIFFYPTSRVVLIDSKVNSSFIRAQDYAGDIKSYFYNSSLSSQLTFSYIYFLFFKFKDSYVMNLSLIEGSLDDVLVFENSTIGRSSFLEDAKIYSNNSTFKATLELRGGRANIRNSNLDMFEARFSTITLDSIVLNSVSEIRNSNVNISNSLLKDIIRLYTCRGNIVNSTIFRALGIYDGSNVNVTSSEFKNCLDYCILITDSNSRVLDSILDTGRSLGGIAVSSNERSSHLFLINSEIKGSPGYGIVAIGYDSSIQTFVYLDGVRICDSIAYSIWGDPYSIIKCLCNEPVKIKNAEAYMYCPCQESCS